MATRAGALLSSPQVLDVKAAPRLNWRATRLLVNGRGRIRVTTQKAPGYIKLQKEAWYDRYPDLDTKIILHLVKWRDSVKIGSIATIADMMNFESSGHHGMPGEIVLDIVFPKNGKCPVEGLRGITAQLSPEEAEAGYVAPKFIQRIA